MARQLKAATAVASEKATVETTTPRGGGEEEFGPLTRLRRTLFPIYGKHETKKFLLIGSIKFFIILALTLTRDTKDTLVVTQCGAEAIAFLKVSYSVVVIVNRNISVLFDEQMSDMFSPFVSKTDIRSSPCSNSLYCTLFENVKRSGETNTVLHDVYPILYLFHHFRSFHFPKCRHVAPISRIRTKSPRRLQQRRHARIGQDLCSLDFRLILRGFRNIFLRLGRTALLAICQRRRVHRSSQTLLSSLCPNEWIGTRLGGSVHGAIHQYGT